MAPPISVPFAPTANKIVCGIPLLIFAALALYWGVKNLRLASGCCKANCRFPWEAAIRM
jgi:hypothetical protein